MVTIIILLSAAGLVLGQQVSDPGFAPPVPRPAYAIGEGPRVVIDEAHHNFHTAAGRYRPFAELLRRDGYRVDAVDRRLSPEAPEGATPVIVFGSGSVSYETRRSLEVSADTPRVPIEGWCQLALLGAGRGRVAVSGEAAIFSAQLAGPQGLRMGMNSPFATRNYQLLLNILHWLTRVPGMPD